MRLSRFTIGLCACAVSACTGAELYVDQSLLPEAMRQSSAAQLCVPEPITEVVPYKLLFIIDTSGSNSTSDPVMGGTTRRETAVRNAINAHINELNVSYGVITFSDDPVRQTFGFTRDTTVLAGALQNVGSAQGGTNYSNTLWTAIDFIQTDMASLSTAEAARTHYLIFFLSDGFPTVGVTDPAGIIPGSTYLHDTIGTHVAEISLNTAFLGGASTPADAAAAQGLLSSMADECNGKFVNIPSGGSFAFDVNTTPIIRKFELALYAATNLNVRLGEYGPAPDSDGDGLLDAEETHWKSDPLNLDTDNDGVRDGVEVLMQPLRSPTKYEGNCATLGLDTDDDGLYDCEENAIGTSPTLIDSDGDLLPDSLEALTGGEPTKADPTSDTDLDGILDSLETRAHLPVRIATEADIAGSWSYQYALQPVQTPAGLQADRACYDLSVDNIAIRETEATKVTAKGLNRVEIWAVFRPVDQTGDAIFFRARRELRLDEAQDIMDPPSGFASIAPNDFVLVGPK